MYVLSVAKEKHVCIYKLTQLAKNTCDSYTSLFHSWATHFLILSAFESGLVTQFYKSNASSILVVYSSAGYLCGKRLIYYMQYVYILFM